MKSILTTMAAAILLATLGGVGPSQAYTITNYTNAALDGCYSSLNTSVDTAAGTNKTSVGTICFDGAGHIVGVSGAFNQTGSCTNTNGHVSCNTAPVAGGGTYAFAATNTPGQGMGTFTIVVGSCSSIHDFSVNSISAGVAYGFQYALEKRSGPPACLKAANVVSGTAWLQQP